MTAKEIHVRLSSTRHCAAWLPLLTWMQARTRVLEVLDLRRRRISPIPWGADSPSDAFGR